MCVLFLVLKKANKCGRQRPNENEVHERRDKRKEYLKDPDVGHCNKSQGAVFRIKQGILMLPHALQRTEGPAEPLFCEVFEAIGRLGQADGSFFIADVVTALSNLDG